MVECVNFAILEWKIAPSEAWAMSYREWTSIMRQKQRNHARKQNLFDYDTAEEFEQYLKGKGLIE